MLASAAPAAGVKEMGECASYLGHLSTLIFTPKCETGLQGNLTQSCMEFPTFECLHLSYS